MATCLVCLALVRSCMHDHNYVVCTPIRCKLKRPVYFLVGRCLYNYTLLVCCGYSDCWCAACMRGRSVCAVVQ